jgi:hypothetical protein
MPAVTVPAVRGDVRGAEMTTTVPHVPPAIERLADFLVRHDPDCTALDLDIVRRRYKIETAIAAWKIRVAPGEDERRVDVIAYPDFPYSRPEIGIADLPEDERPRTGTFMNQTLCFDDPDHPLPILLGDGMIVEVLARVKTQMSRDDPEERAEARKLEFASYWANHDEQAPYLFSLLDDRGPSREIFWTNAGGYIYVAESRDYLTAWIGRTGLAKPKNIHRTVLLEFEDTPKYWPSTNKEFMAVTMLDGRPENPQLLGSICMSTEPSTPVVLRVPTGEGHVFAAAWCDDPKKAVGTKNPVSTKWHGFSPGRAPEGEIAKRFFMGNGETTRGRVYRADPEWLFSRGGNAFAPTLLQSRIVIIGAGSLGSAIARRLIKAGVGHMSIIDPDILKWDNIARHELGGSHVGRAKAITLAETLRRDFPHADVTGYRERWEDVWRNTPDVIRHADLVVSTVAEAGSELHLNHTARTDDLPPILFGWVEDRAAAAQALLVGGIGGCLGCGLRPTGEFIEQVVTHVEPTMRRVPGCDAFYQPYSALEAEAAILMIVEAALDVLTTPGSRSRLLTWIGSAKMMKETGATIREDWKEKHGDPGDGRLRLDREWNKSPECPLCGGNA